MVCLISTVAHAEDVAADGDEGAREASASEWYGWQLLVADGAGIALGVGATQWASFDEASKPPDAGLVGGVWYGVGAVAAPTIHYAHSRVGPGAASFGIRTLTPPIAGTLGMAANCLGQEFSDGCASHGFVVGSLVGLVGASAVDVAFLSSPVPEDTPPRRHWYGWQLLVMDGAAFASGAYLAINGRDANGRRPHAALSLWVPGYVVGFFGGPIVHFAHGQWGRGFASFGVRAGVGPLFALPGLMGYCSATGGTDGCTRTGALWGVTGGMLAAGLFDAFVFANETTDSERARYAPSVVVGPGSIIVAGYL